MSESCVLLESKVKAESLFSVAAWSSGRMRALVLLLVASLYVCALLHARAELDRGARLDRIEIAVHQSEQLLARVERAGRSLRLGVEKVEDQLSATHQRSQPLPLPAALHH